MQRRLPKFIESAAGRTTGQRSAGTWAVFYTEGSTDPVTRLVRWYNHDRSHMSLNRDEFETPARAFRRKMSAPGQRVIDEQTGEEYDVQS